MKPPFYILLLFFIPVICSAQPGKFKKLIPEAPIGWVSDFEKNFSEDQVITLDSIIALHEKGTSNEIAIVTLEIDSTVVRSMNELEELTLDLANKWGVGKKDKKNGVTIVFSKRLRMIRINVGEGLTEKLTDEETKGIIDNIIIPEFKKANYFDGVLKGLSEIIKEIQ